MEDIEQTIIDLLKSTERPGIDRVIEFLETSDYFTAPASTKYHSCYEGGLAIHSFHVYRLLKHKNKAHKLEIPEDVMIICGLLHDICKVNFYKKGVRNVKENGAWVQKEVWEIEDKEPLGHGEKSVMILQRWISLDQFEMYAIRWHMGLPEEYEARQAYNRAVELMPEIVMLHTADVEATHIVERRITHE